MLLISAFPSWCTFWFIVYSHSSFIHFLAHFSWSLVVSFSNLLGYRDIPVAFSRRTVLVCWGKSVVENSPGSLSGYSDWCESFAIVTNASIHDCRACDAWSEGIMIWAPPLSIVSTALRDERVCYGPSSHAGALNMGQSTIGLQLLQRTVVVPTDSVTRSE